MSQVGALIDRSEAGGEQLVRPLPAWRSVLGSTEGKIGLLLFVAVLVIIFFGPFVAPYSPTAIGVGPDNAAPSAQHLLGTDQLGRDVLSRFLTGGVEVIVLPLISVALALSIGGLLGMVGAYKGGITDLLVTRLFDLILTMPPLLLVIVLVASIGSVVPNLGPLHQSTVVVILSVALVYVPQFGRIVRGAAQAVVTTDYVAAAIARGERTLPILIREFAPNVATPVMAEAALRLTFAILFVATLDFLGLGTQPPNSSWGLMVSDGRNLLTIAPLVALAPACGIAALCVSFNLLADAAARHLRHESVETRR